MGLFPGSGDFLATAIFSDCRLVKKSRREAPLAAVGIFHYETQDRWGMEPG
jgi:hypothetical protein